MSRAIILLSGGLDSLVSLALAKDEYNIELALTFDYGQKPAKYEIETCKKICEFYKIQHKIIDLDWLKEVSHSAMVEDKALPVGVQEDCSSVWVPNRNGLFLNIAASIADGEGYDCIIIGANREEGETFPDNTKEFIDRVNMEFEYSTQKKVKVVAPLINFDKNDIVKQAIEHSAPLEMVHSCYDSGEKNCGRCESCTRLKSALVANGDTKYIEVLF